MRNSARALVLVTALGGLALLTGCGATQATWHAPGSATTEDGIVAAAITAPADGAADVPTSGEIALTAANAASTEVSLVDAKGTAVKGDLSPDGKAWLPAEQLDYATTYTATVTASGKGQPATHKATFTTMKKPGHLISANTMLSDGGTYGVGLPIVIGFDESVPESARAGVERRMFVTSEPAQVGSWYWFGGDEVHYRPKDYWQPGTKLSVRVATGGVPFGGNAYGANDLTLRATIGEKVVMVTDNATKTMTVSKNDKAIKTIPISLGKPGHDSSSGNMVVMTKNQSELFVSNEPGDSYRETVYWTQRLTWGGEYLHAAPWSVGDQGKRNVSHGCTNMSTENAKFLFNLTHVGDPVIVKNTASKLTWGNGWTDWDKPWAEYLKGSAL